MNEKYRYFLPAAALAATVALSACNKEQPEPDQNNVDVVEVDEQCPRADGEPCR